MIKDEQIQILMHMHTLEKSIGELYALFAEKFPDHAELWLHLSRDEEGHAEAVRKLYQASYEGQTVFLEGNMKAEAVQSVIDYVKDVHELALAGKIAILKALTVAYDLENSLLEKKFFTHFKVKSDFVDVLQTLQRETQKHARMAKTEIDTLPKTSAPQKI